MKPRLLSVFLCLCITPSVAAESKAAPPNIVLILTDDQGWSMMSERMHPDIPASAIADLHTPAMNRLAHEGMRFTSGYSPGPLCTPTRRSIQNGMTPARQRGTEFKSKWVPADHLTMVRALKQANPAYVCAHFGKWGEDMISTPEQCGYDLLPTFHELAGGRTALPSDLDGGSFRPLLENAGDGKVKRSLPGLVFHRPHLAPLPHSTIRIGDLKLVVNWKTSDKELFDLSKDIGEANNLASARPEKTTELFETLSGYLKSVNAETYADRAPPKRKKVKK